MRPIDTATGQKWTEANSLRMFKEIRGAASQALCKRDRARGIPANGQIYRKDSKSDKDSEPDKDSAAGRYVVDRHLAGLRHTGRDLRLLAKKHWAAFCSTPKDQQAHMTILAAADNKIEQRQMQQSIAGAPDVEVVIAQPPRKPGRPPKAT